MTTKELEKLVDRLKSCGASPDFIEAFKKEFGARDYVQAKKVVDAICGINVTMEESKNL